MKEFKNMYNFSFGGYCGVIVDEKAMKKIAALQYETSCKLKEILSNSDNVFSSDWSIAEEPEELDQSERTFNYVDTENSSDIVKSRVENMNESLFKIEKLKELYFCEGGYVDSRKQAQKEHTEHLIELQEV